MHTVLEYGTVRSGACVPPWREKQGKSIGKRWKKCKKRKTKGGERKEHGFFIEEMQIELAKREGAIIRKG